jgi:hypothetical protein
VTDQAGGFVDDQQVGVFVKDGEQIIQVPEMLTTNGPR